MLLQPRLIQTLLRTGRLWLRLFVMPVEKISADPPPKLGHMSMSNLRSTPNGLVPTQ
jgi:hypothetical protein